MKLRPLLTIALIVTSAVSSSAAVINLNLQGTAGSGLRSGSEPSLTVATSASGGEIGAGIFLDDLNDSNPETNLLTLNVGWGSSQGFNDLSSSVTAAHIHGLTTGNNGGGGFTQTAGIASFVSIGTANLTRSSNAATGGIITNAPFNLTSTEATNLLNGKYYINIHTSSNPNGGIRGFIVIPEPTSAVLLGVGGLVLLGNRRRG